MAYNVFMPTEKQPKATGKKRVVISLRLPDELHDRVSKAAEDGYRSLNMQIIQCLEKCLPAQEPIRQMMTTERKAPYPDDTDE